MYDEWLSGGRVPAAVVYIYAHSLGHGRERGALPSAIALEIGASILSTWLVAIFARRGGKATPDAKPSNAKENDRKGGGWQKGAAAA